MNKRTQKIFKKKQKIFTQSFSEYKKQKNWKPLIYAGSCFIIFLFIWVTVINSDSDDIAPATRESIINERQAVEDLKAEVYTQESIPTETIEIDGEEYRVVQSTPGELQTVGSDIGSFLTNMAPGIGAFIIILGVFAGVAAIIYAMVGVIRIKIR